MSMISRIILASSVCLPKSRIEITKVTKHRIDGITAGHILTKRKQCRL